MKRILLQEANYVNIQSRTHHGFHRHEQPPSQRQEPFSQGKGTSFSNALPEEWDYTLAGLSYINREKIDAVREAIKELESAGYIVRSRERDEKGRLKGAEYVIYEQPQKCDGENPAPDNPEQDNPASENPTLDNPTLEKPTSKNPTRLNTYKRNKEISNTDSINHPSIKDEADEMSRSELEDEIKSNIDYDIIVESKQNDRRQIDEAVLAA